MTCKDCIHYEPCSAKPLTPKFCGTNNCCGDMENLCSMFGAKSKFIELPCSIGDIVYYPYAWQILEKKVTALHCHSNADKIDWWYELDNDNSETMDATSIGKSVFLTREEAEKKLDAVVLKNLMEV